MQISIVARVDGGYSVFAFGDNSNASTLSLSTRLELAALVKAAEAVLTGEDQCTYQVRGAVYERTG